MSVLTTNELNKKIKLHQDWLQGNGGEQLNLSGCSLVNVTLINQNLSNSILNDVKMTNVTFTVVNLDDSELNGIVCKECTISQSSFRNCRMIGSHIVNSNMFGSKFDGSDLTDGYYRGTLFQFASFKDALLTNVFF